MGAVSELPPPPPPWAALFVDRGGRTPPFHPLPLPPSAQGLCYDASVRLAAPAASVRAAAEEAEAAAAELEARARASDAAGALETSAACAARAARYESLERDISAALARAGAREALEQPRLVARSAGVEAALAAAREEERKLAAFEGLPSDWDDAVAVARRAERDLEDARRRIDQRLETLAR